MDRARTEAGTSPGFRLPSSEWTSTPSQISMAILARYSCDRCIGLRVWNAATVLQPLASNRVRVSAGVRNSSPNSSGKLPAESTVRRPARFTPPCSITILTPGCSTSVVRKIERHSRGLSMAYFSVTARIAIGADAPGSDERDVGALPNPAGSPGIDRHGDRDWPEETVRGAHVVADPAPVRLAHEAVERREPTDPEHHDIARLARRHRHRRQAGGALARRLQIRARGHQRPQGRAAMGLHEICHRIPLWLRRAIRSRLSMRTVALANRSGNRCPERAHGRAVRIERGAAA